MQSGHVIFCLVFLDDNLIICQSIVIAAHPILAFPFVEMCFGHERSVRELTDIILTSSYRGLAVTTVIFRLRRLESNGILTVGGNVHVLGTHIVEKLACVSVLRIDSLQIGECVLCFLRPGVGFHHIFVRGNSHLQIVAVQVSLCQACVRLTDVLAFRMVFDKTLVGGDGTRIIILRMIGHSQIKFRIIRVT